MQTYHLLLVMIIAYLFLSVALLSCGTELLCSTERLLQGEEGSSEGRRRQRNESPSSQLLGAATKGAHAHAVSKTGCKPSALKALKGTPKQVSRVAFPRRTSQKGASGVKSHASTKSTKPIYHVAKGASKTTSRAFPKAARKFVFNALRGTAKPVTFP